MSGVAVAIDAYYELSDWRDDPCLKPPFGVMDNGESATITDSEGRVLIWETRAKEYVRELAEIMNENAERLVKSWQRSTVKSKSKSKSQRQGK